MTGALQHIEWMFLHITPLSTVIQSYQDDGRLLMKHCAVEPQISYSTSKCIGPSYFTLSLT